MSVPLVVANQLTKKFDDFTAVDGVDFECRPARLRVPRPERRGQVFDDAHDRSRSPIYVGHAVVLGLDPDDAGPEIRARSASFPRRTTSTWS